VNEKGYIFLKCRCGQVNCGSVCSIKPSQISRALFLKADEAFEQLKSAVQKDSTAHQTSVRTCSNRSTGFRRTYRAPQACRQACIYPRDSAAITQQRLMS
jgi:hypothetical protein